MEEILHQLVDSLSHYLRGFKNIPGGCLGFLPSTVQLPTHPPSIFPPPMGPLEPFFVGAKEIGRVRTKEINEEKGEGGWNSEICDIYIYMCIYICVYIYMYIYIYVYIYMYCM